MTSLVLKFLAGLSKSRGVGSSTNTAAIFPIKTSALNVSLSSTGAGATLANQAFQRLARTLAAGTSETWDWTSFANIANDSAQSFATAIRFFYLVHSSTSAASSITVGNAAANQWTPFGIGATTTFTFKPGEGVVFIAPTSTGLPVDGTHKSLKVLNNDGVNAATYEIGAFGS